MKDDSQEHAEWDSMNKPHVGLALMPSQDFLQAALPLFQDEKVDVLEWSPDIVLDKNALPEWLNGLLNAYGSEGRLLGHGVYYSLFDAQWTSRQEDWLNRIKADLEEHNYVQLTEHFGLMSSNNAHTGFPMPMLLSDETLALGINRLQLLQQVTGKPVGLENLAFAFTAKDVMEHGKFLEQLLTPVNGFLILDLHNLYCQSHNFKMSMAALLELYPLEMVREIHVSGGSWSTYESEQIRRDTHDDRIPEEVLEALEYVLPLCPHLEFVIFEQLSIALRQAEEKTAFRDDFLKLRNIVSKSNTQHTPKEWDPPSKVSVEPITNVALAEMQQKIKAAFSSEKGLEETKQLLAKNEWSNTWSDALVHTAIELAKKWN